MMISLKKKPNDDYYAITIYKKKQKAEMFRMIHTLIPPPYHRHYV